MGKDGAIGLMSFRALGLKDLDTTEFDGTRLLDILRAPFNSRKERVLNALRLFRFLAPQRDDLGPPLGGLAMQVPISPEDVYADGRTPVVLDAEIVVAPEVFDTIGPKPVALQLDRFRVTLELHWYGPLGHYAISQFETGTGRNFAKGERNISETRDIALATDLCCLAVDVLLAVARSSQSSATPRREEQPLDKREQAILDVVGDFQLAHGEHAPPTEIVLSFPPEDADATESAVEALVKKDYIHRDASTLSLTPGGLLEYAQNVKVAEFVRSLMDYLKYRAGQQRARFTHFTWDDLKAANVAGADEHAFVCAIIAILRVAEPASTQWDDGEVSVWACPGDIAALRAVSDIYGLCGRADRIRKEEAAAAEAARQAPGERPLPAAAVVHHHHGDTIMGDKHRTEVTGGIVGAIAVGQSSKAVGTVNVLHGPLTQEQHKATIKEAQKALVDDEEHLGPLLHEVLGQFLRLARDIQVEQKNLTEAQGQMKETLDEVWAHQTAKGVRPQAFPEGLKVVGELAKSPVMTEVLKNLLGS